MDCWIYETTKTGEAVYDIYSKLLKDRTIFLYEEIDSEIASKVVAFLFYLNSKSSTKEIKLYINSPGGTVTGFFAIYDAMNHVKAPIRTICVGEACSAAADLLASGTPGRREAMQNAQIMIHSLQISNVSGSMMSASKDMEYLQALHRKTIEIMADNTGWPIEQIEQDCQQDKYMSAQEALEYGIIDKILDVKKRPKAVARKKRASKR